MSGYYRDKLHGNRLKQCYDFAPPRIKQYLQAEIEYVTRKIRPNAVMLELGCGYGRALRPLAAKAERALGIDISLPNTEFGKRFLEKTDNCHLAVMNATQLGFADGTFDHVICIQNGISAFHADKKLLVRESVRVTKEGGTVFFSSYSPLIWAERLKWFELQSSAGLIGEIDYDKTHDGNIVCKDGFTATTCTTEQFRTIAEHMAVRLQVDEIDNSSIFFVMTVGKKVPDADLRDADL